MFATPGGVFFVTAVTLVALSNLALNSYEMASNVEGDPHTIQYAGTSMHATVRHSGGKFEVKKDGKVLLSTDAAAGTKLWAPTGVAAGPHQLGFCKASASATAPCVSLQAPESLAHSAVYSLPATLPTVSGHVLSSTTTGAMSWVAGSSHDTTGAVQTAAERIIVGSFSSYFSDADCVYTKFMRAVYVTCPSGGGARVTQSHANFTIPDTHRPLAATSPALVARSGAGVVTAGHITFYPNRSVGVEWKAIFEASGAVPAWSMSYISAE